MIGARKPKLPLVSIKTIAIIIAAKIIIFMIQSQLLLEKDVNILMKV